MMPLFATRFSTILNGLLILSIGSGIEGMNILKTNNIEKEETMPSRDEIPLEKRWNVEALYASPESWRAEFAQMDPESKWKQIGEYKGRLHEPAAVLGLFETYTSIQRKLEKLYVYAHLRMDEDLGNDEFKTGMGMMSNLAQQFSFH